MQDSIVKLFNLICEETEIRTKFNKSNSCEQLKLITDIIVKKQQEFLGLEKQLQKYESEVRKNIREQYLMQQQQDELQQRIEELEKCRDEFLNNTKITIIKLKRENEEMYQKVKSLTAQLQKIDNQSMSKYSTVDNTMTNITNLLEQTKIKKSTTPQKLKTEIEASQKRLSQQIIKPNYFQKKQSVQIQNKRQSYQYIESQLNLTTSM